jgi:hypothetical protein
MANIQMTCPKCQGAMETGFILDYTYAGRMVSSWIEGEPESATLFGRKVPGLAKMKGRRIIEAATYRCTACGYLESYARP